MIISDGLNGVITMQFMRSGAVRDPWCIMFGPMKLKRAPSKNQRRAGGGISQSRKVVEAKGLAKSYGKQRAVDGIEFFVKRGETFGLVGPNGAGKSTTMRMIACRTPLTSGELLVESLDVRTHGREIRSRIGVVPQENNLDPDLNVIRNLIVYASYFRIPRTRAAQRADELLHFI